MKLSCVVALALGIAALILTRGEPLPAFLKASLVACTGAALAFGLGIVNPPRWLRDRAVLGTVSVHAGIACIFLPPSFIFASVLIGAGIRLLALELAPDIAKATATIRRTRNDIAVRPSGGVSTRD